MQGYLLSVMFTIPSLAVAAGCDSFAAHLDSCQAYVCTQTNPLNIEQSVQRKVAPEVNSCGYQEYVDNQLMVQCSFNREGQIAFLDNYNMTLTTFFNRKKLDSLSDEKKSIAGCFVKK